MDFHENVVVVEYNGRKVVKISPNGNVTIIAGNERPGYVDGEGGVALFNNPVGVCVSLEGDILIADYNNNLIRKISQIDMFATRWPKSHHQLGTPCQNSILELLCYLKIRPISFVPRELIIIIVKYLIRVWFMKGKSLNLIN